MLEFVLLLIAVILLALATAGVGSPPRFSLGWAGLTLFVLVFLIEAWPGL
jgi:hypothetical protein